jgi:hypothetical protein
MPPFHAVTPAPARIAAQRPAPACSCTRRRCWASWESTSRGQTTSRCGWRTAAVPAQRAAEVAAEEEAEEEGEEGERGPEGGRAAAQKEEGCWVGSQGGSQQTAAAPRWQLTGTRLLAATQRRRQQQQPAAIARWPRAPAWAPEAVAAASRSAAGCRRLPWRPPLRGGPHWRGRQGWWTPEATLKPCSRLPSLCLEGRVWSLAGAGKRPAAVACARVSSRLSFWC